jgi:uncharacterized C2H2 Zn-finger protein
MTRCPECEVPVRVDRLEKHIKRVHRGRETLPARRIARPDRIIASRFCPHCGALLRNSQWTKHINSCPKRSGPRPVDRPIVRPPARYIIDEFGVVQSYEAWWRNQNLAETKMMPVHVDGRLSETRKSMVSCPSCDAMVRRKNLSKHLKKVHGK